MKNFITLFITATFIFLSAGFISCGSSSKAAGTSAGSEKNDSSSVFVILDSNPSTGYSWVCSATDKNVVELVTDQFIQNDAAGEKLGLGGKHTFILQGKKEGKTQVSFTYARTNSTPSQKRVYEVTVAADLSTGLKLISAE